jgi:hypothetical protein
MHLLSRAYHTQTDHLPLEYLAAIKEVIAQQKELHSSLEQLGRMKDHGSEDALHGGRNIQEGSRAVFSGRKALSPRLKLRSYGSNRF